VRGLSLNAFHGFAFLFTLHDETIHHLGLGRMALENGTVFGALRSRRPDALPLRKQ
jgi:hypothetical protein